MTTNISSSRKMVLVIGAAGLDIIGRLSTLPDPGVSTPAVVRPSYGGVARNVAENLARLGQPVSMITAVGQDPFGRHLLKHSADAGVDISACMEVENGHTASYLAVLKEDGHLYFALDDMRILSNLTPAYLRQNHEQFHQAGMVFIDANLSPASIRTVLSLAHRYRIPVCADSTSKQFASRLSPHLSQLKLITANIYEASILIGSSEAPQDPQVALQVAHQLVDAGSSIAMVSLAEFGVCYASSETYGHVPAIHTNVLDSTGAGDALTATVIFGLMNEMSLDDAIRLGVSAASLTLRYPGTVRPDLSLELLYDQLVI